MLVALAVALPFLLLTAGIVWKLAENERANRREAILYSTRALMIATDALLSKHIAIGQILATSIPLQTGDYVAFRQRAERVMEHLSGGWIVVSDQGGQQIVNLLRAPGDPMPRRNPTSVAQARRAIETGTIQISDVFVGSIRETPIIAVDIPVIRKGLPPLSLAVILDTTAFKMMLDERHLPEGWLAGILDRKGNFVARSREHERFAGRPGSEGFRTAAHATKEGWNQFASLEGESVANAHVTSNFSGWVVGLAAAQDAFEAPIRRTIFIASLAGAAATLLSVLMAVWAASRIAAPINQIEQSTHALLRREPIVLAKTGVSEVDRALDAFVTTASTLEQHEKDRDEREAHVRLIMRELSHRSKNLLAIVLAIARQTARTTTNFEEFDHRFNARIQALADAHDLLVEQQWAGAALDDLVRAQLSAFGTERVTTKGGRVVLRAEAVQNVALALHELATNAVKYGALSVPQGRVTIEWEPHGDDPESRGVRLTWRESGGPPVTEPERKGFGRFVLERVTVNALGAGGTEFKPTGLVWTCDINAEHLVQPLARAGTKTDKSRQRLAS
jgi:two-component sensor histidine kinase